MTFLQTARNCLEEFLPGLDQALTQVPMLDLEQAGSGALAMFKEAKGPTLLVPKEFGGMGASLSDAVHIQRAIGSRSPSLAVATTMHHFSVGSLVELTATGEGFEWAMLEAIAGRPLLERSYAAALEEGYLWHEFGDVHLVLP